MILRTLLLKTLNAVLNKAWGCRGKWKAQTKRNRGKERNLEHPHCSCCKARPCSFISPAWRVVTGKSCARDRSPHGPPGTRAHGHAADPRAHGQGPPEDLAREWSWDKRLICGRTLLEIYLACSANSSIKRLSPHSNAHHQVPPVQKRILPFAYLSNRWWMPLNAYTKHRITYTVRQRMTDDKDQI